MIRRIPTSSHTIGPFFPQGFFRPGDNDLTRLAHDAAATAQGEPILLRGRITREGGAPCVNMLVEIWQADSGGRFRHPADPQQDQADPGFMGWGRAWTDLDGTYWFRTVLPGGYAEDNIVRAPHINMAVMGSGLMRRADTILWFPDFAAANESDPVLAQVPPARRRLLVAAAAGTENGERVFRFDLRLRGQAEEETPLFAD